MKTTHTKNLRSSLQTALPSLMVTPRCLRFLPVVWLLALCALLLAGGQSARAVVITVTNTTVGPGTWVCPAGVTSVQVECWGGGGAGGSCVSGTGAGGGGAGGAYAINTYGVTANTTYYLYVGAAGAAGAGGNNPGGLGGSSWFNTVNSSNSPVALGEGGSGGGGGAAGVGGTGASCPSGSVGSTINLGGSGLTGVPTNTSTHATAYGGGGGGSGGNSSAGNTGLSLGAAAAVTDGGPGGAATTAGGPGAAPTSGPGGGGGGAYSTGSSSRVGGVGFAGQVVLTYTALADFKSVVNGNWSVPGTWNISTDGGNTWGPASSAPNSAANAIFVTNGFTVTVDVPSTSANLMIDTGSTLVMGAAGTLNGGKDLENILLNGGMNFASSVNQTNSGIFSGAGSVTNSGTGVMTLAGISTYTGNTVISSGRLAEQTGGSASSSALYINSVTATNSVSITTTNQGWTFASLTVAAAGDLDFNFGAVEPGTAVVPLQITGAATFSATPSVNIEGTAISAGTYPLMTWGGISGTPPATANLILPANMTGSLSVSGNTLYLTITLGDLLVKANNANALDLTTSWVTGVVPTGIAIWDDTVTSPNTTVLGGNLSWAGIQILNPGGTVTISADGNTLTNGTSGIDMSAATVNLNLNCSVVVTNLETWNVASGLTLTAGGPIGCTTTTGGIDKQGAGTVVMQGSVNFSNVQDVLDGTLIYNGAAVTSNGRVISDATTNCAARLVITNGASVISSSGNGNLRAGRAGPASGTNYVDLAGLYSLPNTDAADGFATLYGACAYSQMTFWPGADFTARGVTNYTGEGNTAFMFRGGTLRARQNNVNFFEGVSSAYVGAGGGTIDDSGFGIVINENLSDGSSIGIGSGGLTKIGAGSLTLAGYDYYTGPTVVNNGTLVISNSTFLGGGSITVASNATLNVTTSGNYITVSSLNAGYSTTNYVTINFLGTPTPNNAPAVEATALNGTGTCLINIQGSGFVPGTYPLIGYTTLSGSSSFVLGSLPLGVSGTLQKVSGQFNFVVTVVPKNLEWSGAVSANWDLATHNWYDLNNGDNPTNYAQTGTTGDMVTFDANGGANPNVNIGIAVTPTQLLFANNGSVNYTFTGSGSIGGAVEMVMNSSSTADVTMNTVNTFTGGCDLQGGILYVGNSQALGTGTVAIDGTPFELACAGTSPVTLTNPVVLTTAATTYSLGDAVNTGVLTLAGTFDFGSTGGRTMTVNSDVILAGAITNESGGANTINGSGRLIITGRGGMGIAGNAVSQTTANVIVNGGSFANGDGWRMTAAPGVSLLLAVTNGGALYITNSATENMRVGYPGGDSTGTNTLDVAGTFDVWGNAADGTVNVGGSGALCSLNVRAGGLVKCNAIINSATNGTISTANFYGGTLVPNTNTTAFMQALSNAYIWTGLIVDTTNNSITIAQPLLAGGAGGLTKNGVGTLTLSGSNSYTGGTVVNAGKLVLVPGFYAPGSFTVNANATLDFQQSASNTVNVATVSIGSGANSALEADLATTNTPAGMITNLILNGSVLVNVTNVLTNLPSAGIIPLFGYGTISGSGSLAVGQLPPGVSGTITTNTVAKTINLTIASAAPTVPHITTLTYLGSYLGIAGTNGNANGTYYVLSSTNIAIPLTNWTMAYTGTFSATGSFTNSLPISASTPQNFFLIKNP